MTAKNKMDKYHENSMPSYQKAHPQFITPDIIPSLVYILHASA